MKIAYRLGLDTPHLGETVTFTNRRTSVPSDTVWTCGSRRPSDIASKHQTCCIILPHSLILYHGRYPSVKQSTLHCPHTESFTPAGRCAVRARQHIRNLASELEGGLHFDQGDVEVRVMHDDFLVGLRRLI